MSIVSPPPIQPLDLPEPELEKRFDVLQRKLSKLWETIHELSQQEQTIVVVPSISVDYDFLGAELQGYEERMLFMLLLLRQPHARVIYVTSQTILPSILDYYLSIMPGVIHQHARDRFFNVAVEDRSSRPLTVKLLERPHVCEKIRSLILDPEMAHLVAFNVTRDERNLALRLGIPIYGADPKFWHLGSKCGSRTIFSQAGISYPLGYEDVHSFNDVLEAILNIRRHRPQLRSAMLKLNDSVSGQGNAVIDLSNLPDPEAGTLEVTKLYRTRLESMEIESGMPVDIFLQKLEKGGGIVEERIQGIEFRSPSVQLRITPLGETEVLSSHDQLLGGTNNQTFLGSQFPSDPDYGSLICQEARKVAEHLANQGVLGRLAVDFVVVRDPGGPWQSYAIEINLRKGGTTHPFLILQFLTDGSFDEKEGVFRAPNGERKYYVSSDNLQDSLYRLFTPQNLIDILTTHKLHFDQTLQKGVLLHMLATLGENGRFGAVAVESSPQQALDLFHRLQTVVKAEARKARQFPPLP